MSYRKAKIIALQNDEGSAKTTKQMPNEEGRTKTTKPTPKPVESMEEKRRKAKQKEHCLNWVGICTLLFLIATIIFPVAGAIVSSSSYEFIDAPQGECKPKSLEKWDCKTANGRNGQCSGTRSHYVYLVRNDTNPKINCTEVYEQNYCSCSGGTPDPPYEGDSWAPCWIKDCSGGGYTFSDPKAKTETAKILFIMTAPFGCTFVILTCYVICCVQKPK
eukprot:161070_1